MATLVGLAALAAAGSPASAVAAGPSRACTAPVTASLPSDDPTVLEDGPAVILRRAGRRVSNVRVTITSRNHRVATGSHAGALGAGTTPVQVRLKGRLRGGPARLVTTAKVAGCGRRTSTVDTVRLRTPSLPVRTAMRGSATEGGRTVVSVVLRAVGGHRPRGVRVQLRTTSGRLLARSTVKGSLAAPTDVALYAGTTLRSGAYRVVVTGRAAQTSSRAEQRIVLRAGDAVSSSVVPARQHAAVDWSGGKPDGRDVVGFSLPGIGHGELVCSPETQWVRVFPNDPRREVSMMNWTYKDWRQGSEKALREGLHTQGTGPDFSEAFGRFIPPEKQSTGEFIGLIADRGPYATPGTGPYAAPISLRVTWSWDFTQAGNERCHAEIDLTAQTPDATGPAVVSAQTVWRGDAAAPGRDSSAVDVPGLGRLTVICQAGPEGQRTALLDTGRGGTIIRREGTADGAVPQGAGPLSVNLPNNGQIQVDVAGGGRLLISSRWKVNDPNPAANFCAVAVQAIAP